jgi:hypothetical protein
VLITSRIYILTRRREIKLSHSLFFAVQKNPKEDGPDESLSMNEEMKEVPIFYRLKLNPNCRKLDISISRNQR